MMQIWQIIRQNPEEGARKLVSEYGNRLFGAATLLCQNDSDAEELVFRTFTQAISKIKSYVPTSDFFNWLYTIMLNFWRMKLRKKHVDILFVGTPTNLPDTPAADFLDDMFGNSTCDFLLDAIKLLDPILREIVALKYFEDKSIKEIAEILTIPVGTVKSRLYTARTELYNHLSRKKKERIK